MGLIESLQQRKTNNSNLAGLAKVNTFNTIGFDSEPKIKPEVKPQIKNNYFNIKEKGLLDLFA